jgi:hypothetical protein
LEIQKNVYDNLSISEQVVYKTNAENRVIILDDLDLTIEEQVVLYDALENITYEDEDNDGVEKMVINDAADSSFRDQATGSMRISLRLAITVLPVLLITGAYFIFNKKYFITEEYYDNMLKKIVERRNKAE